jgi:hypothetical protein
LSPFDDDKTQLTQMEPISIDQFTINEHNLSDGDFDRLLLSGRFHEWKAYATSNAPSLDERNLQ